MPLDKQIRDKLGPARMGWVFEARIVAQDRAGGSQSEPLGTFQETFSEQAFENDVFARFVPIEKDGLKGSLFEHETHDVFVQLDEKEGVVTKTPERAADSLESLRWTAQGLAAAFEGARFHRLRAALRFHIWLRDDEANRRVVGRLLQFLVSGRLQDPCPSKASPQPLPCLSPRLKETWEQEENGLLPIGDEDYPDFSVSGTNRTDVLVSLAIKAFDITWDLFVNVEAPANRRNRLLDLALQIASHEKYLAIPPDQRIGEKFLVQTFHEKLIEDLLLGRILAGLLENLELSAG